MKKSGIARLAFAGAMAAALAFGATQALAAPAAPESTRARLHGQLLPDRGLLPVPGRLPGRQVPLRG